jgi:molecular chaperone HscA
LQADGHVLLKREEFVNIAAALDELLSVANGTDIQAIKHAISKVDNLTKEYAARRMDHAIRQAMQGHTINEFTEKL